MSGCDHVAGFWGRLPGAIVAGAGGVVLVGGLATRSSHQVLRPGPAKIVCTNHFLSENRSFVDFEIGNESVGGDLEENNNFQQRKCVTHQTKNMENHVLYLKADHLSILK